MASDMRKLVSTSTLRSHVESTKYIKQSYQAEMLQKKAAARDSDKFNNNLYKTLPKPSMTGYDSNMTPLFIESMNNNQRELNCILPSQATAISPNS